jgi:pimeloyl-ACP methyl ester carboxylesterase/DNA-binding CsgD family transcriptional regulator
LESSETRFCESADGMKIAYAVDGEGPPLIYVGLWTYSLDYQGHRLLTGLRDELARERSVVNFDRRGIGASEREIRELSLEAAVSDIDAVADAAGLSRFDLVGTYDGAHVAASYCVRHPERVRRVVFLGLSRSLSETHFPIFRGIADFIDANWEAAKLAIAAWMLRGGPTESLQWAVDIVEKAISAEAAKRYMAFIVTLDSTDTLPSITAPSLVLHWRDDPNFSLDEARAAAALMSGSTFLVVESADPLWMGGEKVVGPIMEFLRGDEGVGRAGAQAEREVEILALLAGGLSNQQIARDRSISTRTVERHIGNIYLKIGAHNRAEATAYAIRNGFGPSA